MKSRVITTPVIIVMATTGTTIAAIFPSRLNFDASSEYGATLAIAKPFTANVLFVSYYDCN